MSTENQNPNPWNVPLFDPEMRLDPQALAALKAWAKSKPWRGDLPERIEKLRVVHEALCDAYGVEALPLDVSEIDPRGGAGSSAGSTVSLAPEGHAEIQLRGKFSVLTYLFMFAIARQSTGEGGVDRDAVQRWAVNAFQRAFPASFRRLRLTTSGFESVPTA